MDGYKKRTGLAINGMTAVLSCALLLSCNSEDFLGSGTSGNTCDNICFGISPDENPQTRNGAEWDMEGYTSGRFVLRSDDSADTLCVRAVVTDGIRSSSFEKGQAVTRGASVSKENFYDTFHVLAYWKKNGTLVEEQFYMDEDVTDADGDGTWNTAKTYYWPGEGHTLRFCAWAPADAGFTSTPAGPADATIEYTVPQEAAGQKDIVVARSEETDGDYNKALPLSFRHVCTAVRFVLGSQMQPGTIRSVALKGVRNSGAYSLETSTWTLHENSTGFFRQELNMQTAGTETGGTAVTTADGTFMMLPQVLPEGAMVEVVFDDRMSGQTRTLTASLAGQEWPTGTTVTYRLSITPEYDMNIEVPDGDKVQDAHYVSFPITVKVEDFTGRWTLTSNLPGDVFFTPTQTGLQKQGYWIDEDKGQPSVSGTGSGTFTYYVYATENIGDAARDIVLQIKPADYAQAVQATATVKQLCPSWNGTLGCERIEDGDYPWGFYWTDNYKVVYDMTGCSPSDRQNISVYIRWTQILHTLIPSWFPTDISYVDHKYEGGFWGIGSSTTTVTINFGQLNIADIAISEGDGLANTKELYNFNGISQVADIISRLEACAGFKVSQQGNGLLNPTEYAARACALKNKYIKQTSQGNDIAVLPEANFVWYLPSKNEFSLISDTEKPLKGEYWTSTADNQSNEKAYKANSGTNTVSLDLRNAVLNVRAVRKKK